LYTQIITRVVFKIQTNVEIKKLYFSNFKIISILLHSYYCRFKRLLTIVYTNENELAFEMLGRIKCSLHSR